MKGNYFNGVGNAQGPLKRTGRIRRANEARWRAMDELQAMGQDHAASMGACAGAKQRRGVGKPSSSVVRQVKKLYGSSSFSEIKVQEPTLLDKCSGYLHRTFASRSRNRVPALLAATATRHYLASRHACAFELAGARGCGAPLTMGKVWALVFAFVAQGVRADRRLCIGGSA